MSRIAILLCTGHRLFAALLLEARAAMDAGEWSDVQACLAEFALRLEIQMQAEESVLFPCLAGRGASVDTALVRCRLDHRDIEARTRAARAAADARDQYLCELLLDQLGGRLSLHCQDEEERLYPVTYGLGKNVLVALARALVRGVGRRGEQGRLLPPNHRLH